MGGIVRVRQQHRRDRLPRDRFEKSGAILHSGESAGYEGIRRRVRVRPTNGAGDPEDPLAGNGLDAGHCREFVA